MAKASDPIQIGSLTLKNRVTMAPTVKFGYSDPTGNAMDIHVQHYRDRAAGGAGLICVEATAVTPDGRFTEDHMGLWDDSQIPGQKAIVDAVHAEGVPIIIQLNHTGITKNPMFGEAYGPSEAEMRGHIARAMTIDEIHAMEKAFIDAAVRAKKAGYDGIQLHACHSYLINQFESPLVNHREDEYGGSPENCARFGVNIIKGIRELCGPDFLISARITGFEESAEFSLAVAEAYVAAGCEYLQVSNGFDDLVNFGHDPSLPFNEVCALGVMFHDHFQGRVPVSVVNGILTPEAANFLLENDLCDTVDLGRGILADPTLPRAITDGTPYVKCFDCKRCQYGPFTNGSCPAKAVRNKNK